MYLEDLINKLRLVGESQLNRKERRDGHSTILATSIAEQLLFPGQLWWQDLVFCRFQSVEQLHDSFAEVLLAEMSKLVL